MPRLRRLRLGYGPMALVMAGTLLSGATPMAALARDLTVYSITWQLQDDTVGALLAEKNANTSFVQRNQDGTSNVLITAGTATQYVEVAEMLPTTVTIKPGDTVTWVTKTIKDPHTVTFPRGPASESVDPLPAFCEAQPSDTPPS